jgi:hypothetical protein
LTTTDIRIARRPALATPYSMAARARALREAGRVTEAMELEIQLAWDGRCVVCGHRLRRDDSQAAATGQLCARLARRH